MYLRGCVERKDLVCGETLDAHRSPGMDSSRRNSHLRSQPEAVSYEGMYVCMYVFMYMYVCMYVYVCILGSVRVLVRLRLDRLNS